MPLTGSEAEKRQQLERFKPIFDDRTKVLVGQNIKYDYKIMHRYGMALNNRHWDTMVAHYLMDADSGHGMDQLAANYLNYKTISITELIGKKGKSQGNMADLDPAEICDYACEDADITLQLYQLFLPEIEQPHLHSLFYQLEMPLLRVLADMEIEGVHLDRETLKALSVYRRFAARIYRCLGKKDLPTCGRNLFNL